MVLHDKVNNGGSFHSRARGGVGIDDKSMHDGSLSQREQGQDALQRQANKTYTNSPKKGTCSNSSIRSMDDAVVDSHVKREIARVHTCEYELLKNYIKIFQELVINKYNWHKPISLSNIPTYYLKASLEIS